MLVGSGPEGTFGSEIPANDDGWEKKEGRDCGGCVCPASVPGESPTHHFIETGYGLADTFLSILVQLPFVCKNHLGYKPYCKFGVIPWF